MDSGVGTTLTWKRAAAGEPAADNGATIKAISTRIKAGERAEVIALLAAWNPEDVIELLVHLPLKRARKLFDWLPAGPSEKVLAELRPEFRAIIIEEETIERLRELLEHLPAEAAAETLSALPDDVRRKLLRQLSTASEIAEFAQHSAGRVMTRRLLALTPEATAGEAIEAIREHADLIRKLDEVYVIDPDRRLIGSLSAKRLLFVPAETPLGEIMQRDVVAVSAELDQEEVSRIAARKDLRSVPVVDAAGKLLGQITVEQLKRISSEEAAEDLMQMSAVSADARPTDPIRRIVTGRLPWLLAGLIGATIAAIVVGSYEEQLAQAAILAAFIPVVMSLAGNSGLQASAVTVQALASGAGWASDVGWRFFRELGGAMINGTVAGIILAVLIGLASLVVEIDEPLSLALATSLALLIVTSIAALVGAFVPIALNRIGINPAIACGVFITTSNDVLGVLVFFTMAKLFYLD